MPFKNFDELNAHVKKSSSKTLVVAAAHDGHTLEAVYKATKELPMNYILVGERDKINDIAGGLGWSLDASKIVDTSDDVECARKAVELIRSGQGNALMKGILDTSTLLKAVLDKESGLRENSSSSSSYTSGSGIMSHVAVLESPAYHKLFVITDGGMNPHPNLEQKAAIVKNAVEFLVRLGYQQPKVAALSASEAVSEKIPESVDAAALAEMCKNGELGNCILEGPLSFDLAVSKEAVATKRFKSNISGDADILLVPDITSGNILSKGLIYLGNAKMAGCVLGVKTPIVLVSRGATAVEKLLSILLCLG